MISTEYVFFGGHGPPLPADFRDIVKQGQGRKVTDDPDLIHQFEAWIESLGETGYAGPPLDWSNPR